MINCDHGYPSRVGVASFTHVSRVDMGWRFSGGLDSIVATGTVVNDVLVIEYGG